MNAKWHKSCYATFTSMQHIKRLEAHPEMQETSSSQAGESTHYTIPLTRTRVPGVNWKLCIFCQRRICQEQHQVMSHSGKNNIRDAARKDHKLKCLIGENY